MRVETTERGFAVIAFVDANQESCSLQESSAAQGESLCWLGVDEAPPKHFVEGQGWVLYPVPASALIPSRMHLTQGQVRELLPHLTLFAETGRIGPVQASPATPDGEKADEKTAGPERPSAEDLLRAADIIHAESRLLEDPGITRVAQWMRHEARTAEKKR